MKFRDTGGVQRSEQTPR